VATSIEPVTWRCRSMDHQGAIDSDPTKFGNNTIFWSD